jgi:hypothetical protein
MSAFCLLSAKGSPGVTTTTVGLSLVWAAVTGRRALVLDADPCGGDTAAGILRGSAPPNAGMLALATSRQLPAVEAIEAASVALDGDGCAQLVSGVPDGARAAALPLAWDRVVGSAAALEASRIDVLVDAGRHDPTRPAGPWLGEAGLAILVVRPTLPAVAAAHRLGAAWTAPESPTEGVPLELVVVEAPSPYRAREVASAVGLPLLGVLPHQPEHARVHSEGAAPGRGFARSAYVRALHQLARDLGDRNPEPAAEADRLVRGVRR